jgi:hypothetical protein
MSEARKNLRGLNGGNFQAKAVQPGQQFEVDLKNATQRKCDCGSEFFIPAMRIYTVSAIVSPTGQELTAQTPAVVCMECRKAL